MNQDARQPGDAEISAWIDGMLDKDGAAAMTELAASNEAVAARAQRLRDIDGLVRMAVPAEDEIPAELLQRLGLAAPVAADTVVDFAAARDARASRSASGAAMADGGMRFWRIAAQVLLVAGLGLSVVVWNKSSSPPQDRADYRALSDAARPAAVRANALVVFAEGVEPAQARAIAAHAGANLVGTPNDAGAWQVAIAPARLSGALAALRADPRVTMAEPVDVQP